MNGEFLVEGGGDEDLFDEKILYGRDINFRRIRRVFDYL